MNLLKKFPFPLYALLALAASALPLRAAPTIDLGWLPNKPTNAQGKQAASVAIQTATLRSAYSTLASTNHNYNGHRQAAMQAIAQACSLLGSPISGDGKGQELQLISDFQLHSVQASLQLTRAGIPNGQQPQIAALLNTAITEITRALATN